MLKVTHSHLQRYSFAVLTVALALLAMLLLKPLITMECSPFMLCFAAVIVSVWYGGLGPGLLAMALAIGAVDYLFISPINSLVAIDSADSVQLVVFSLVSLLLASLNAAPKVKNSVSFNEKVPQIEPTGDVNSICSIALDVTGRKHAEESLQQSEECFRSLCACSPVGIFLTDTKGYCTYTNPRLQAIADFTFKEALGMGWVQSIHPDDRERVFDDWSAHAQDAKQYSDEFRFQTRAEVVRWVHVRSSPMLCDNGKLIGYVGTVEDVTELMQDEERLLALNHQLQQRWQQLEEISRLKSKFLVNMSYELRTPLTSILGFSSILLQEYIGAINLEQEQYLSHIHTSGEYLLDLINALLDLAKIEADKLEPNFDTVDLAQLCHQALDTAVFSWISHNLLE